MCILSKADTLPVPLSWSSSLQRPGRLSMHLNTHKHYPENGIPQIIGCHMQRLVADVAVVVVCRGHLYQKRSNRVLDRSVAIV